MMSGPIAFSGPDMNHSAAGGGRNVLILSLFVVLLMDQLLGLGLGIVTGLSFKNVYLYALVLYLVSAAVVSGDFTRAPFPAFIPMFVFLAVYGAVSWAVSSAVYSSYATVLHLALLKNQLVDPLLFLCVFFFGCRKEGDALWLAKGMCAAFAVGNLVLLVDFFNVIDLGLLEDREDGRLTGAVGESNQFAALLLFFLSGMIPMALGRDRSYLIIAGLLAGATLFFMTGSRGGLVGLVGGSMLASFLLRKHLDIRVMAKVGVTALVVLALIITIVVLVNPEMVESRLDRTTNAATLAGATSGRSLIWARGLLQMWESPLTLFIGFGWNMFVHSMIYPDPHNHYLFLFYGMGAIGLGIFLGVIVAIYRTAMRALDGADATSRRYLIAFLFGLSGFVVPMMFVTMYSPWPFVWAYIGVMTKLAWLTVSAPSVPAERRAAPSLGCAEPETYSVVPSARTDA